MDGRARIQGENYVLSVKAKKRPETKIDQDEEQLSRFISENPGSTVEDAAAQLNWTGSRISRALARLKKKGIVSMRMYPISQTATQQVALTPEISDALRYSRTQLGRLEKFKSRLQLRDKELFEKCVSAQMARDSTSASMYANQCAEIRRLIRLVSNLQRIVERFAFHQPSIS